MTAKDELLERLKYIDKASYLPELIDNSIQDTEHNKIANLLRKGLSIVAFNILEDFIRNRTYEALDELCNTSIPFTNLPDTLQDSSITKALSSLQFQQKILKKEGEDYKSIIQTETLKIASTLSHPFQISKYSFVNANSNISAEEIKDLLKAFGVSGGWSTLQKIGNSIGAGIPNLNSAFSLASERRHSSAHSASFGYNLNWLQNLKYEIIGISSSIDIVLNAKCRQAKKFPYKKMDTLNFEKEINIRFLQKESTQYLCKTNLTKKTFKTWTSLEKALQFYTKNYRLKNKLFLMILDENKRIIDWK
ncbi:HEPN domain-containing protein [Arachidicoccus terrestris]|uniref:HEPN domain-containing protein n=1 Tax=Arachidicoccus terrestris TaxID=2875539 RepID=UPI001CC527EF|nr:HEPN domain-containing protein [Arachidicoccus terrestris]UAY55782.1 hypothetical protein K9M52_01730 [Arachidicoccus terrestris]